MKKYITIAVVIITVFACKKEGGSGKPLYLSKVFTDDLLSEEYIYSTDKKVIRRNMYSTNTGQSKLYAFRLYEYDDDKISTMRSYNDDGVLADKRVLTYNGAGNVSRMDTYGKDEVLDYYYIFEYSNSQLSKIIGYAASPVKKTAEWLFAWNAQNKMHSIKRYWLNSGIVYLSDSAVFDWSDKTMPAHWQLFESLMINFPIDNTLLFMFADSYYYYYVNAPPTFGTHYLTQKTYNSRGYLVSQNYNLDGNNGLGPVIINHSYKYEYIE